MIRTILHTCLILTLPIAGNAADEYWPGWLGPNRDGWVADFQPPEEWPSRLQQKWQVKVGAGYGSPLVANGYVYQHARQGEDEVVWCIDLKTGKAKWRKNHRTPFKMGGGGERHGKGPKSSPAYADGRVFAMSITGNLSAFDAESGKLLWRRDYEKRFKQTHPHWGTSNSPVVDGNKVIAHFGNDEKGVLVALNAKTGHEVWTQGNDGTCYSSPLVVDHYGIRQVIEWNHRAIVGVESRTGRFLWEYPFPHKTHNQNMPTPSFHDGQILVGGENRGFHAIQPILENGRWSVKKNWSQKDVALDMSSAVVNNGLLYGMSHYKLGQIFCLDPGTGKVLWTGPPRTGNNVMFLSLPGHILALINNGTIHVVKAQADSYEKVATWSVSKKPTWAPPVLLQSGILIKDLDTLTFWKF
jgi:outer membrane protein assembly factor BamB